MAKKSKKPAARVTSSAKQRTAASKGRRTVAAKTGRSTPRPASRRHPSGLTSRPAPKPLPSQAAAPAAADAGISAARLFALGSLVVLVGTTIFWSVLAARLQKANADQLIAPYLFESFRVFHMADFPGAHSQLIKWPLFALMQAYGNTEAVYVGATVLMVLAAVGSLAAVLWRIERRPLVFGLLCLALSSVLLLTPAQPYPGALLPDNMAMATTRNLEYGLYILALCLALRAPRLRSWPAGLAAVLFGLLAASDRLFAVLVLGAALTLPALQILLRGRPKPAGDARLSAAGRRLLCLALAGVAGAVGLLLALDWLRVTAIVMRRLASPFPFIHSAKQLAISLIYAVQALLTNFGANPLHSVAAARRLPGAFLGSLHHASTAVYGVNLLVLLAGLYAALRLLFALRMRPADAWSRLAVMLLGSTLAAGAVFVLTDHYYPVDARYVTIALFALFIAAAAYIRGRDFRPAHVLVSAGVLLVTLPFAVLVSWHEYQAGAAAEVPRMRLAGSVADELTRHKISRLAGNYWDVTPVKATMRQPLTIMPVEHCTEPRGVLSSRAWFSPAPGTPAAFLAIRDGSPVAGPDHAAASGSVATYDGCSLAHVVSAYGVPTERVDIGRSAASQSAPDVLLLLYGQGMHSPAPASAPAQAAASAADSANAGAAKTQSLVPFTDNPACSHGTTLQVVAHQDDDLLFMNPDLQNSIKAGRCVRTVYVTAGDAGEGRDYWGGREEGAKAAYAEMFGVKDSWHESEQMLAGHQVTVDSLLNTPQISLLFLRLPDGNLRGEGFQGNHYESLHKLLSDTITAVHPVDGRAPFSKQDVINALLGIMTDDLPDQIRTLASNDQADGDHADHHAVGSLVDQAAAEYLQPHSLLHYLGYPDKTLAANVSDDDVTLKLATFLIYARHDGAVCQSAFECQHTYTYGHYLTRQYQPMAETPGGALAPAKISADTSYPGAPDTAGGG